MCHNITVRLWDAGVVKGCEATLTAVVRLLNISFAHKLSLEQRQCSCQQGGLIVVSARYGVLDAMLQAERRQCQGLQAVSTSAPAAAVPAAEPSIDTQPDRSDAGTSASTSGVAGQQGTWLLASSGSAALWPTLQ